MKKKNITKEEKCLCAAIIGLAVITISVGIAHENKSARFNYLKEPTAIERGTLDQNLNKSIKKTIIKDYDEDTLLYLGISNHIIDTAWRIESRQGLAIYDILDGKRNALVVSMEQKEDITDEELQQLFNIEKQLQNIKRKYGSFYGWRLIHRCWLAGNQKEIVIESDSTGTNVKEVYGDRVNFKACKDSAILQEKLRQKVRNTSARKDD